LLRASAHRGNPGRVPAPSRDGLRRAKPGSVHAIALFVLLAGAAAHAETPIPPPPADWVTDRAQFLAPETVTELDGRLGAYAQQTGHQLLVYVDHTTGGVPIEDWAVKAFERWKVGRKGIDDGLVLFIFKDDHRLRIEVGYGLEDRIPDILASRIINDLMVPRIRAGDPDGAVRAGVDQLTRLAGGGSADHPVNHPYPLWAYGVAFILGLLVLGFIFTHPALAAIILASSGRRGGGLGGGGGFGSGGGFSGGGRSGGGGASGSW
jgi:uncharacterized protein